MIPSSKRQDVPHPTRSWSDEQPAHVPVSLLPRSSTYYGSRPGWPPPCASPPARVADSNLPPALQPGFLSPGPSSAHSGFDLFFTTPGNPPPGQNLNARHDDGRRERDNEMISPGFPYAHDTSLTKPALPPRPYDLASHPSAARRSGLPPLTTWPHLADSDRSSSVPILPPRPPNDDDWRFRSRSIAFGEGPASPTLPTPLRPTVPPKLPLPGYGHLPPSLIPAATPYSPTSVSTPFSVPQTPIAFKNVWEARAVGHEMDAPIVSRTPSATGSLAQSDLQTVSVPSMPSLSQGRHARSLSELQLQEVIRHSLEENNMASHAVAIDADAELALALHESLIVHPSGQSLRTQLDDGIAAQKEREEEKRRVKEEENERKRMEEESERVARALVEEEERERQMQLKRIRQEEEETRRRIEREMEEERIRREQALAERKRREEEEEQRLLAEKAERARQEQEREQQRLEELEREQLRKLKEEYEMEMRRREEAERERERLLMEKVRKVEAEQKRREEEEEKTRLEQERRDRELARRLEEEQERERQRKLEEYEMEERRREEAEREKQRQLMDKANREQKQREMERKREEEEKRARLEQERADEEVARRLQEEPDCIGEFELEQQRQLELELEQEQRRRKEAEQERERMLLEKAKKAERGQRKRERERDEKRARLEAEQQKGDEEIARVELEEEAKMKEKARRKSSAATDGGRGAQLYQHYAQRAEEHTPGRARPKSSHESASPSVLQSQRPKSSHGSLSSSHTSARPPLPTSSSTPHAFSSSTPGLTEAPPQYTALGNNNHATSDRQQQPNTEHARPQSHLPGRSSSAIAASALREQENLNIGRSSSLGSSAPTRPRQPRIDTDVEEYDILKGVAFGFNPPSIRQTPPSASGFPPCPPFPEIITFGKASRQTPCPPPLHIMATSWKHLVSVLAMQDQTRLEADLNSIAHNKERDQCLRVVIQFVKLPYTANIWHTVIHLTLDEPLPLLVPNAHSFTNGDTTVLPYSYTQLPPSSPHRHFLMPSSPNTSEIYVIPLSAGSPFPILPITLPNLALYLQSAMTDSIARKVQSDLTNSMRRLARFVGSFYPDEWESDAGEGAAGGGSSSSGSGRVSDVFGGILGRVVGRRKRESERETVDYSAIVTPFRVNQYA